MEVFEQKGKVLPNANAVLVLGILSLVFCWCYGIIGLILGIISLVLAGSSRRIYQANPENYDENSYKNLNTGRICAIIGICISSLIFVFLILVIVGLVAAGGMTAAGLSGL